MSNQPAHDSEFTLLKKEISRLTAENSRLNEDYLECCKLVAQMHFAVTGIDHPMKGVVEDCSDTVAGLTAENEQLKEQITALNKEAVEYMLKNEALLKAQGEQEPVEIEGARPVPLERRVRPLVVVQTVWVQVSADYDSVARTRTLAVTPEMIVGEVMRWAAAGNVLGRGDVVLTEQDHAA